MQKTTESTFAMPTMEEMADFLFAIEPTPFGPEYVILGRSATELVLCEVRARAADGRVLHARILPFN